MEATNKLTDSDSILVVSTMPAQIPPPHTWLTNSCTNTYKGSQPSNIHRGIFNETRCTVHWFIAPAVHSHNQIIQEMYDYKPNRDSTLNKMTASAVYILVIHRILYISPTKDNCP